MNYSKSELKKMFLRVLYECQHGTMQGHSSGIDSIVPTWINKRFSVLLTKEEIQVTFQAIDKLRRDGFLVKDATQNSDNFLVFTSEGKDLVETQRDPDVHGIQLEQVVGDGELLKQVLEPFKDAAYEMAIFSAYKNVEERVRRSSGAAERDIGVDLITTAFHPEDGRLAVPSCRLRAEQEGVYNLFKGAIQFFKNPSSHRTVNYDDRKVALEIIVFADLLLQILSTSRMKP